MAVPRQTLKAPKRGSKRRRKTASTMAVPGAAPAPGKKACKGLAKHPAYHLDKASYRPRGVEASPPPATVFLQVYATCLSAVKLLHAPQGTSHSLAHASW